jgi:hypothetical protein
MLDNLISYIDNQKSTVIWDVEYEAIRIIFFH